MSYFYDTAEAAVKEKVNELINKNGKLKGCNITGMFPYVHGCKRNIPQYAIFQVKISNNLRVYVRVEEQEDQQIYLTVQHISNTQQVIEHIYKNYRIT